MFHDWLPIDGQWVSPRRRLPRSNSTPAARACTRDGYRHELLRMPRRQRPRPFGKAFDY